MAFNVEAARKAGYSDAEIADYLAADSKLDAARARKAGYTDSELIAELAPKVENASVIPGTQPTQMPAADGPQPSALDQVIGVGETALNLATGATGGAAGMVVGTAAGLVNAIESGQFGTPEAMRMVEQSAARGAQALTYEPRTPAGQAQTQAVGNALQQTIPVAGMAPQLAAVGAMARPAAAGAAAQIAPVARQAMQQARQAPARAMEVIRPATAEGSATSTPGTLGSMGAAGTDMALQRRANAQELPTPIALTEGQATRRYDQQRFERETAKDAERGGALRARFENQNEAILRNFDQWVDQTGAEAPNLRAVGAAVDKAIVDRSRRDKTEINAKYAAARRSPEAQAAVDQNVVVRTGAGDDAIASTPLAFINEQPTGLPSTALTDAARQYAVRLGVADLQDGQLIPRPGATISHMEAWRKAINEATSYEAADIRQATILKKLIDGQTEPVAGPLFREARRAREVYANRYENVGVIKKLLDTKRGTNDRQVAFEDVFDHTIRNGSLDDVRQVRKVLQTAGEDGQQAWRELQGQTVRFIRDEAAKSVATDSRGNVVVSASGLEKALRSLDADGKLDFVFGKKGAEQMRLLNDVAKDVLTAPPGSVNTSNTASVLAGMFDLFLTSGSGGVPLPIATGLRLAVNNVKDRRLRQRILVALGDAPKKQERPAPRRANSKTMH